MAVSLFPCWVLVVLPVIAHSNMRVLEKLLLAERLNSSVKRKELLGNSNWMLHLIATPDFDEEAVQILGKSSMRKLFKNKMLKQPYLNSQRWSYRALRGGWLRQPPNNYVLDFKACDINFSLPESRVLDSLIIAWAAAWSSNHGGNEIVLAKDRMLLSVGGGPATVFSCSNAILRAKECAHDLKNSVFAADSFFPFIDAPEELIKAGCLFGIVPRGGKNFELVRTCFRKHKVNVFYIPEEFRGFCRH